ncbi:geranylgeranyl pyrophosphate synthase [Folsomia candida]|uniref:Geranylgeranyl pyrophosphate synthase n=1 Tax=Folsomia candida TaxID=158441 RepID=A0A226EYJ0_FOLCA|nr:geranylgeranyl pyrophosphate synthase [Folsomia candida]OXA62278.1 Geranylgeranyl pyrophosphate synthase [Folsomia candida]
MIPQLPKIVEDADKFTDKILLPYSYLVGNPGKDIRAKMIRVLNYWIQASEEDCEKICEILDLLHNASLMIDDIEDRSAIRRGKEAAHVVYGVPLTMNAAHFIYFKAIDKLLDFCDDFDVIHEFLELMKTVHFGQGAELYWRDCAKEDELPSERDYQDIIAKKTTSLALMAISLLKYKGTNKTINLTKFVTMMGLNGQILDDLRNLTCPELQKEKGFCEDLTEGKLSYPIIHLINNKKIPNHPEKKRRVLEILKMKTSNVSLKEEVLIILEESGCLNYTKKRLQQFQLDIIVEAAQLGPNPELAKLIEAVKTNMVQKPAMA